MFNKNPFLDLDLVLEQALTNYSDNAQEHDLYLVLKQIIPSILDGVILFDEHNHMIYANSKATAIIQKFARNAPFLEDIPAEIAYIKRFMVEAKEKFSHQNWLNQFTIFVDCLSVFHVHGRWIQDSSSGQNYLLLKMEDQNQFSQNLALEEAKRLGLTLREQEVWLLYRANYTYKQIAETLNITPNTVKKHMKSILVKQRSVKG
ncbi:LuxR C-terminal-related transcriptional regulator [Leptolyngbya sp. CCNP1308]|uniref:helix-turn-helix transcriptional regulator n=1 Tax=Leptolyngbya sp. CCNP1308 TaxID=3110255 RepID=UPI002B1FC3FB|nr:LuxR C-terminal-related transcriptional regulator [Leptolyngbya sp. CCNP1308]MEA5448023.1 LuxR C-terminal-related transcriptional regulator [Leptolyngbya sp. CCNP1308]